METPSNLISTPPTFTFQCLSYNIGGLRCSPKILQDKVNLIQAAIKEAHVKIILLQETHLHTNDITTLPTLFPSFQWFSNNTSDKRRGVAIGIKSSRCYLISNPLTDPNGTFIQLKATINHCPISITSIYFPPNSPRGRYNDMAVSFFTEHLALSSIPVLIGGDLNLTPSDPKFLDLANTLQTFALRFINNPYNSRMDNSGRIIDHFITSENLFSPPPIIYALPPPTKDHAPLILIRKREPRRSGHRVIPPHIASHPAFIKEIKEIIPKYDDWLGSPIEYLNILNSSSHLLLTKWENEPLIINPSINTQIWAATSLLKICLNSKRIPLRHKSLIHQSLYTEFQNKPENTNRPHSYWRRKDHGNFTQRVKEELKTLKSLQRPQIYITPNLFDLLAPHPSFIKPKGKATKLNIINPETGFPATNPSVEKNLLKSFWEQILSSSRPHNPDILETIIQDYPKIPPNTEVDFSDIFLEKVIKKSNKSSTGPDGIPFCLYSLLSDHTSTLWMDLCNDLGNGAIFPPHFTDSRLVLIPKEDHPVMPSQTRPISITNASYRIIMKTWADAFRNLTSDNMPPYQKALLKNRFIDDCIDDISNAYKSMVNRGDNPILLQTDFQKAFDFLNRESIIQTLSLLNYPANLINVAKLALSPSMSTLYHNGTSPVNIQSVTGVKQGCPLSPIIFIIVFDLLNHHLSRIPGVELVRGYMDDIAIITSNPDSLNTISHNIQTFCQATGASLNFDKCFIISPNPPVPVPATWTLARQDSCTQYLGIQLSHNDDDREIWIDRMGKMNSAVSQINSLPSTSIKQRITLTNIFVISHIPYFSRFAVIPEGIKGQMSRVIRSVMKSKNLPNVGLYAPLGPFAIHPTLINPTLLNIACLAGKRPPSWLPPQMVVSPNTIEYKRRWAINYYYRSMGLDKDFNSADPFFRDPNAYEEWKDQIKRPTHSLYLNLVSRLPPFCPQLPYSISNGLAYLSINLHRPLPRGLKQNLILYFHKAWGHRKKMAHVIHGLSQNCRFLCGLPETNTHLLECGNTAQILSILKNILLSHPIGRQPHFKWPRSIPDLLCLDQFKSTPNIILRLIIISAIRTNLITRGKHAGSHPTLLAENYFTSALSLISSMKPPRQAPSPASDQQVSPPSIPPPSSHHQAILYFDGAYDIDHAKGGAGSSLVVNDQEISCIAETIPFGSVNSCEYRALVNGKILAIRNNITHLHVRGDSALVLGLTQGLSSCSSQEVLLIHAQSLQLDKHFHTITYEKIERKDNQRADQLAHAAAISDERGQHYALHPDDKSRPTGPKTYPLLTNIKDSQLFILLNSQIPSQTIFSPIHSLLKPKRPPKGTTPSPEALLPPQKPLPVNFLFRDSPFLLSKAWKPPTEPPPPPPPFGLAPRINPPIPSHLPPDRPATANRTQVPIVQQIAFLLGRRNNASHPSHTITHPSPNSPGLHTHTSPLLPANHIAQNQPPPPNRSPAQSQVPPQADTLESPLLCPFTHQPPQSNTRHCLPPISNTPLPPTSIPHPPPVLSPQPSLTAPSQPPWIHIQSRRVRPPPPDPRQHIHRKNTYSILPVEELDISNGHASSHAPSDLPTPLHSSPSSFAFIPSPTRPDLDPHRPHPPLPFQDNGLPSLDPRSNSFTHPFDTHNLLNRTPLPQHDISIFPTTTPPSASLPARTRKPSSPPGKRKSNPPSSYSPQKKKPKHSYNTRASTSSSMSQPPPPLPNFPPQPPETPAPQHSATTNTSVRLSKKRKPNQNPLPTPKKKRPKGKDPP